MEFLKIWGTIVRRKWIIITIFLVFFLASVVWTQLAIRVYRAQAQVLIETPEALTSLMSTLGVQTFSKTLASTNTYDTDIALVQIRPLLESLVSSLSLKDRSGKPLKPQKLVRRNLIDRIFPVPYLKISQYKDADMIEIVAFSANSSEAANMANKLAEMYVNYRTEMTRKEFTAARLVIEGRLQKAKEDYYDSLYAIKDFRMGHGVADPSVEIQNLINKILSFKASYEDNEVAIQKLEVQAARSEEKLKETKMFTKQSEQFTSDLVKTLKGKLNDLLIDIASKSMDITKEHPEYKKLEKQIAAIRELMMTDTKVFLSSESYSLDPVYQILTTRLVENYIEREVAIAKRSLFKRYIDKYENELLRMPEKSIEMSKLELATAVNRNAYQKLLEYLSQVGVAESVTLSKLRVVDAAEVPDEPYFPEKSLNYILGIFLGLFWGLVAAFFTEYIDNTVRSAEDIGHIKSADVIGTVPNSMHLKDRGLISTLDPTAPVVETYRTIKNSILYASIDNPMRTMAVTSSMESEGKSSLASNISITFCREGKRVILVDLNLRNASIHRFFNISNNSGITNVLTGEMQLEDAISHSSVKGLDLLTSGPIPNDPGVIIESKRLGDVISSLRERYDTVVIDTPPLMPVNDAVIIGRLADGMLYVVESGKVTSSMLEYGVASMEKAGINIVGYVLNKSILPYPNSYYARPSNND